MKLIVRVARTVVSHRDYGQRFAQAVADLARDGHSLVVVHGSPLSGEQFTDTKIKPGTNGDGNHCNQAETAEFIAVDRENRALVSLLARANVTSIGLRATDARLLQLRRKQFANDKTGFGWEAVRLDSRWLEIICSHKGVPVLSNLSSWIGQDHLIDPDQMAAVCAADWKADALIYLTEEDGVPGAQGGILRWFDVESNNGLQAETLSHDMRARLQASALALRHGVRRVKILPMSNVDSLSLFYFSPIEHGTEVIASALHS
jgi:acetylglutamate kinase